MRTPKEKNIMTYKKVSDSDVENSPLSDIAKNTQKNVFRGSLPVKKSDPFQKEQDHLAEEVRRLLINILKFLLFSFVFVFSRQDFSV